jgi:hypothetical protein
METKKRRIRIHRGLTFLLAILLALAIAVVVFQRSGFLSYQLSAYVNDHYFKDTPFRFSCGEVTSDLVSHASVADPVIRYQDESRSVKVFSAGEIRIGYDFVQALRLKIDIKSLELDKVRVSLRYDEEGKPILPVVRNLGGFAEQTVTPDVRVDKFVVYDLEFAVENKNSPFSMKGVDLSGSAGYVDGRGKIEINQARGRVGRNGGGVSSLRASVEFQDGRVTVKDLTVRLDKSLVMVNGGYDKGRLVDVQGLFNPLNLDELSSMGLIDNGHGELGGSVLVNGTMDSLSVEGSVTGNAQGLVVTGIALEGSVTPRRVHLSKLDGQVHGSRLHGGLTYDRITGSYTFDGSCEELDITEGFVPEGGGAPPTDLNGSIRVEFDGAKKTYNLRADLHNSTVAGYEGDRMRFAGTWSEKAGLNIRSFDVERHGMKIGGFGSIDAKKWAEVVFNVRGSDLDYTASYFKLPPVGGTVDLAGKLTGPMDDLKLNANGTWNDLTYLDAVVDSSRVSFDAMGVGSLRPRSTVNVEGRQLMFAGLRFSHPHVLFDSDGKQVVVKDFSFSKGDTLVTMDFEARVEGRETPVTLKHVAVQAPNATWRNGVPARLIISDQETIIDSLELVSNGSLLGISGRYSKPANSGDLRFWGKSIDLSVVPELSGSTLRAGGRGDFEATIRGDFSNPDVGLSLRAADGFVPDLTFSRLAVDGEFSADGYRLDRLCIVQGKDSLVATGSWKHMQSPVAIARSGLDEKAAWDADIAVDASCEGFPIDKFVERVRQNTGWSAAFSGRVILSHTPAAPAMRLSGVVRSKASSGLVLPDIEADLGYENSRLTVQSLSADDGKNRVTVRGVVPLGFDIERGFEFNPKADVDFEADLDVGDLSILAGKIGVIAAATGKLSGHLNARGPADNPRFEGNFVLRDAALRVAGSNEIFRDIAADLAIRDDKVTVTSLKARKEKKGSVEATGTATLKGFGISEYAFDATVADFPFTTIPGFQSIQSGKISVKSRVEEQGRLVPFVSGSLDVKEAVMTRSLAVEEGPPSPLTMPTETPSWLCDLQLHAPKNVWVRNPEVTVEMGGDLILKRDRTGLYLRGDLAVLRGSYTLYNNKFSITDGSFDFATATTLRPGISLDAYTPHGRTGDVENKIFLSLSWPADEAEPKITLSYSEAGYSEADIWAMLGGQVVAGAGAGGGGAWNAGETATSLASGYLERILNAQMSNMTVAVEPSPAGQSGSAGDQESAVTIAVGRYLSNDLYLNYRQGLRITSTRQIDIEYRLSNVLLLRSEIIQRSQKGLPGNSRQATDEINFDLKFHWEY